MRSSNQIMIFALKILFSLTLWLVSFRMYMCEYLTILLHGYINNMMCLSHVRFSFIFIFLTLK